MARLPIRETLRSLFSYARSLFCPARPPIWPDSIRRVVRILFVWTILIGIVHLSLSAALAHVQLNTKNHVQCWDIDSAAKLNHDVLSNKLFHTTTKKLPVTFVNVDVFARIKGASGPRYLYMGSPKWYGGKAAMVACLIVSPLFLVLSLVHDLVVHLRPVSMSHRLAMIFAAISVFQFLIHNVNMFVFDAFPHKRSGVVGEACWRSDGTMEALARVGRWAKRIRIAGQVVGSLGIFCMMAYFLIAYWASVLVRFATDRDPVPLADLSGLATNPPVGQAGNANSVRPAGTSPSPSPSTRPSASVGPKSGQDAAPSRSTEAKQGQQDGPQQRLDREFDRLQRQLESQVTRPFDREHERHRERRMEHDPQVNNITTRSELQLYQEYLRSLQNPSTSHSTTSMEGNADTTTDLRIAWNNIRVWQEGLMQQRDLQQRAWQRAQARQREPMRPFHSAPAYFPPRRTEEGGNPFADPGNVVR